MATTFPNLDMNGPDIPFRSSHSYNGPNPESYHVGEIFSGNSSNNSEQECKVKSEQFLNNTVVTQKRSAFEQFVKTIFKDSKEMNRHFDSVKNSLGSKLEQVFSPETMIEYFDRISQKPISRIGNTKKTRWSDDEVLLLTHMVIYYTLAHPIDFETLSEEAWVDLSSLFPNKDASQLKKRWQGCLKKTLWQVPWTQQEDDLLIRIIDEKGHTRKWKEIAEELNARSDLEVYRHGRQCRERWNNHLDPTILRNPFTEEEDIKLFQLYKEIGKKWAEISKKMKNRTENAVKNRFNSLIKKLKTRQSSSLCENHSIGSTESDNDSMKLEKKLVEQFLQQFAHGSHEIRGDTEKTRSNNLGKNMLYDNSEAIFESDSDSYTQEHKQVDYLDKAFPKKKGTDPNKAQILGELKDCLRKMPSSNYHMEEEYLGGHNHLPLKVTTKYENLFSNPNERFNQFPSNPLSQQFANCRRDGSMICENAMGRNGQKLQSFGRLSSNYLLGNASANQSALDIGYKSTSSNLDHQVSSMDPLKANINNLNIYLDCENSNPDSPVKQNRFPFDNYENKFGGNAQMKLEEEGNEMSPTKRIIGLNHQFKAKRLDKHRTQCQIGRSNLQYAIVDLTKNEIYMVHPVTKENFNGTISKMSGDDLSITNPFENISNGLKTPEFLMLGKSGEHSPSFGYLQSLMSKPSFISENSTNTGVSHPFHHSAEIERPKPNSMGVEERYQDIRKKFGIANQENHGKQKKHGNASSSQAL